MRTYQLKRPVPATRYELNVNEREAFDLVNFGRASFINDHGSLHCYNNQGRDVDVQPGEWVASVGDGISVLEHAAFVDLFVESDLDF